MSTTGGKFDGTRSCDFFHRRSVNGQRYFTTSGPMRGVFVRPERVVVGDYPEVDEFADMMDDSEDEI